MISRSASITGTVFSLLLAVNNVNGQDCGYVQTSTSISDFASLDTCGTYSYEGLLTTTTYSFMYSCNSDESQVDLYFWLGSNNCSTFADASSSVTITDDSNYFNCGPDDCGATVTLALSNNPTDCNDISDTYITYPFLTGYCVYYTNDDTEYSEYYTCTDSSLIYEEYNTSDTCSNDASYSTQLQEACATLTIDFSLFEVSGSFLYTVDECNNAFGVNVNNNIVYGLGIILSIWSLLN